MKLMIHSTVDLQKDNLMYRSDCDEKIRLCMLKYIFKDNNSIYWHLKDAITYEQFSVIEYIGNNYKHIFNLQNVIRQVINSVEYKNIVCVENLYKYSNISLLCFEPKQSKIYSKHNDILHMSSIEKLIFMRNKYNNNNIYFINESDDLMVKLEYYHFIGLVSNKLFLYLINYK
jgi:hypothetical protein